MDKAQRQKLIREKLGLYLSRARDAKGLSQEELGELADLSTNHISKIERGCTGVKFENLLHLCVVLELSLDDFVLNEYLDSQTDAVNYREKLQQQRNENEALRVKEAMSQAIDRIYKV